MGFSCKLWVMDSYFMTKEKVKLLSSPGYSFVSKIKSNRQNTYQRKRRKVEELYENIAESEFEHVDVVNPKTKEKCHYLMVYRDVFVLKIGVQRILFLRKVMRDISGKYTLKYEKKWTCLVSNILKECSKRIVQVYLKRWTIETGYRDGSQELHLKGYMIRNIEEQYCFITLVFIAYRLLTWAARLGFLSPYHLDADVLSKKWATFLQFHKEIFGARITSLKEEYRACKIARVICTLIYGGNPYALDPP
ncbi:MAG: transposase [Promethearchaeota archaeon]